MLTSALDTSNVKENESCQHLKHVDVAGDDFSSKNVSSEVDFDAESSDSIICSSAKGHVLKNGEANFTGGDDVRAHCCLKPLVSYEAFVWVLFIAATTLAIVDRFTTNVWPRQVFSIGSGSAGNDRLGELCVLF